MGAAELAEEARPALLEAILALGSAHAIEQRLVPPESAAEAVAVSFADAWGSALPDLRTYLAEAGADWEPAASAVASNLELGGS